MNTNKQTTKTNSEMDKLLSVEYQQLYVLKDIQKMINFFYKLAIIVTILAAIGYVLWLREILF